MPATIKRKKKKIELEPVLPSGAYTRVLLKNEKIPAGKEKRLLPNLDVRRWDRLHFHFSNGNRAIDSFKARILFGTPMAGSPCSQLLADSTIWFEETVSEREFSYSTPANYNGTGFVMSVPVVAPRLFDVIMTNLGTSELESIYVTVMAQEI